MRVDQDAIILEELYRRETKKFVLKDFCFDKQLAFIKDPSPFKTAVCSRRAGKTVSCAADLIDTSIENPGCVSIYITLTRGNAKKIIWKDLININYKYELNAKIDNTELTLTFPNGSMIYLSGAKDRSEIEKFRGLAIKKVYIDEGQSFRDYIKDLIDDVLGPALMDYDGSLILIGTPGPVPAGYFYDTVTSEGFSHHAWTFFDNPFIIEKSKKTHHQMLQRELKRRGVTIDHPSIQREFFGKWVIDTDSLVFKYNRDINDYDDLPIVATKWNHVIGIDLGHDDADAIAVIAWNDKVKDSYLIHEDVQTKQGITELAAKVEALIKKYDPLKIVIDTGGLGKKIAEELRKRYAIPVVAAEKQRKFEYIEILNDALRTKRLLAKKDSRFAQDSYLVEWDYEGREKNPDKLKISDRYHSDICDAVLYAYREALHWLYEPEIPRPKPKSAEWFRQQEEDMERDMLDSMKKEDDSEENWGLN